MTLLDLRTLTLDMLDDPQAGYFTVPSVNQKLNLNLRELQKRLISSNQEYYSTCVTTPTVAYQEAYALPADFMQIVRLDFITQGAGANAQTQKIEPMTPNQRDLLCDQTGQPGFYFFQKNNIMLQPIPDSIYTLHLEYSYFVADMVLDTDIPDAPQQFHPYIAYMTARDCMVKDGRPLTSVETQLGQYELLLKQIAVQRHADKPRMVVQTNSMDY